MNTTTQSWVSMIRTVTRLVAVLSCIALVFSTYVPTAAAATGVPRIMNYQGRLMNSSGTLLGGASGADYCVKFSLYDDATIGGGDVKLWPSGSPSTMTVTVRNGIFNAGVGDTNAGGDTLDFNFEDNDASYLNVEVATKVGATCAPGDGAESFENLSPRQRVTSSGYAINSATLGGLNGAYYLANSFSTTSAAVYTQSSTTIPKTYANNSFIGINTFADIVVTNATSTHATSTDLYVGSTFSGAGLTSCSGSNDKLVWDTATKQFACGTDLSSGGGADGNWTFFNNTGIRPATTSNQVLVGGTATTSLAKFEAQGGAKFDNATSTTLNTTVFGLGGVEYFTSLAGTGLQNIGGVLTLNTAGDWTGTLDGYDGSYYLANSFSTTSAAYFAAAGLAFSTTSAQYFASQNPGESFSTTSADYWKTQNNFHSTSSFAYDLSTYSSGYFFSTTSVNYWESTQSRWATTSSDAWLATKSTSNLAEGTNLYYTPSRVAGVIAGTTTDALAEGSTNQYFTTNRVASVIAGTTTDALAEGSVNKYYSNGLVQTYLDGVDKGYFFSTTSALYFNSQVPATPFATTSADYWKSQRNFHSTSSFAYNLSTYDSGYFFSTTSVAYWDSTQFRWATTSSDAWLATKSTSDLAEGTNLYYTPSRVAGVIAGTTTDALAEGSTNKYYQDSRVATYINGSSTIPSIGGSAYGDILSWNGSRWGVSATSSIGLPTFANLSNYFTLASWYATTTDALDEGVNNLYFTPARVASVIAATTTDALNEGTNNLYFTANRVAGVLAATTTDAIAEGSANKYYTDNRVQTFLNSISKGYFFSTTSASSFASAGLAFSTTSSDYWKSVNNFHSTSSFAFNLSTYDNGSFFSTTSVNFWESTQNRWATTSSDYWLSTKSTDNIAEGLNLYFTPSRVASVIAGTTTDALAEGTTNKYYSNGLVQTYLNGVDKGFFFSTTSAAYYASQNPVAFSTSSANYYMEASTTIPKTYSNNTFTGSNDFQNVTATGVTSTASFAATASSSNLFSSLANIGSLVVSAFTGNVITASNATTTNFYAQNASTSNINANTATVGSATVGSLSLGAALTGGNGGTGLSTVVQNALLIGGPGNSWTQISTSSLGLATYGDLGAYLGLAAWYATTTDALAEGSTNQYFTPNRVAAVLAATTSDAIAEGTTNKYFTTSNADAYLNAKDKGYFFSTTSASAFLTLNQGNAFSTTSAAYNLSTYDKGYFFSTTSVAYWDSTQFRWATTSSDAWLATKSTSDLAEGTNLYYTPNRVAGVIAGTTTDALDEGSTNKYYNDSLVNSFIAGSTTIPKTFANNTFIGVNSFANITFTNATSTSIFSNLFTSISGTFGSFTATSTSATSSIAGSLLVGTSSGSYKVSVMGATTGATGATGTAIMAISNNDNTLSSGNNVLRLNIRTPYGTACTTGTTCPRFEEYFAGVPSGSDTGGRGVGSLRLSAAGTGITQTSGSADFAEYMQLSESASVGDLVSLNSNGEYHKAVAGESLIGVISDNPAFVGNGNLEGEPNAYIVGFAGVIQTTVSTANGSINAGDLIAASDVPGVGIKLSKSGYALGQALQSFTGPGQGTITVLVMPKFVDAAIALESYGGGASGASGYWDLSTSTNTVSLASSTYSVSIGTSASTSNLVVSNGFTFGKATGVLKSVAGVVTSSLLNLASDVTGVLGISNGGTGTSTAPAYGQILVGNAAGGYDLIATSSLGNSSGSAIWGAITGTLSAQTDLQNALDQKFSLSQWYATTTDALNEGSTNRYFTTNRVAGVLAGTTTDAIAEGSTNKYYNDSLVQGYLNTIEKGFFFSTTSALQFASAGLAFSTTSTDYWKAQNNFHSTTSLAFNLGTYDKGYFFSTTSVAYWDSTQFRWATTSSDAWLATKSTSNLAEGTNLYYTPSRVAGVIAGTTTDALAEGSTNKYYSNGLVDAHVGASTTIPKTFSTNTFTATNNFQNITATGATTTSLSTGSASTTNLTISGLQNSMLYTGPGGVVQATSITGPLQFSAGTLSIQTASGSQSGALSAADYTSFNSRLSSTSLSLFDKGYFFSTTSNQFFTSAGLSFSTTSTDYWKSQNNFFSTSSTDYWKTQNNFFSTTSASYFSSLGLAFSTSSASNFAAAGLAFSTTSASYYTSQNQGASFSTTSANAYMQASTTVPTTYKSNTFTGTNSFQNITATGATTTSLSTGIASTTNLTISALQNSMLYTGAGGVVGAVSVSGPIQFSAGSLSIQTASATQAGALSSSDWNAFNSRLSTSSLSLFDKGYFFSTTSNQFYTAAGLGFSTTSTDYYMHSSSTVPTTYKNNTFIGVNAFANITATGATTTSIFSTTASSTNVFATTARFGSVGAFSLTGAVAAAANNITGINIASTTDLWISNIRNGLLATNGQGSVVATSTPSATSFNATSATVASQLPLASTTYVSVLQQLSIGAANGTILQGGSTGTSTIAGFLSVTGANSTSTFSGGASFNRFSFSATSTGAQGINLTGGCFSVNGLCIAAGAVNTVTATNTTLLVDPNSGNVGIGLNLSNPNVWTGLQQFGNATTTMLEAVQFYARTIQSTSTNALVLKSNFSSTAGLTFGSTSTPQVLAIDTINNRVTVGTGLSNTSLLVLDSKNTAGDPSTGVDGSMYFNSNIGSFRCYNGGWITCGGEAASSTGNVQYKNVDGSFTANAGFTWSIPSAGLVLTGASSTQTTDLLSIASSTGRTMFAVNGMGVLSLGTTTDPVTPPSGELNIYAKEIAGRVLPKWTGPSGVDTPFQASLGFNRTAMIMPAGGATATTFIGGYGTLFTNSVTTAANPTPATTNLLTSTRRATFSTSATANTITYHRQNTLMVTRGNASGVGGFFYTIRFGTSATQTGNRVFVGLSDSIANPTNVDPTTSGTIGRVGLATNANTGNWKFVQNVAGTAPTVYDLGASFPIDTTSLYELVLFAKPNDTIISYRVKNLSTGAVVSSTTNTTNLPANTTFLAPQFWYVNVAAAIGTFDFGGWYLESDN